MKLALGAIALCILCLIISFVFAAPAWVNIIGVVSGIIGLFLLGRVKKGNDT